MLFNRKSNPNVSAPMEVDQFCTYMMVILQSLVISSCIEAHAAKFPDFERGTPSESSETLPNQSVALLGLVIRSHPDILHTIHKSSSRNQG